jgi:hypothetical protein
MKSLSLVIISSLLVNTTHALVLTSVNQNGVVEITATQADNIVVSFEGDSLRINNGEPNTGPITVDQIKGLNLVGSDDPNTIDFTQFNHPKLRMNYRINVLAKGGDDTVIGNNIPRVINGETNYIDLGSGNNTLNLENSPLIFFVIKNDLSANDTIVGTNLDINFLWRLNDSDSTHNSTIEIKQDENNTEFIELIYDNGTTSSVTKLRGITLLDIKCSNGNQQINVSNFENNAVDYITYNFGTGNNIINTPFLEDVKQHIIGSENQTSIDTLNLFSSNLNLEHDLELGVLETNTAQGYVVYLNMEEVNVSSQEIDIESDIWQVR